jgi:hypothetical protein
LKGEIQNQAPATIDHTNMAFQSALEMFVWVDPRWHHLSTFPFWHFLSYNLLRRDFRAFPALFTHVFVLVLERCEDFVRPYVKQGAVHLNYSTRVRVSIL